ncbi:hypothetical protein GCWU000341_02318 [Oribacterium sp. oral taxon 078 str. F0262]|uniref:hypothetical protein n=1 Tax=Oribacterium sp. oral taxon 078 TaxID=652706 RepID=UPI0001BCBE7A|nr:hypothetical protein [Oribacterium sp. oral taxon 078]EFE91210.1 hypothetical protein GCWU000341_02318 [Oribacterium sp. oral taxon 078 str. F0262]
MIEEFEARTGIYPSIETYRVIEEHYYQFDGNKDDFCKAFKENHDGIAQRIQRDANNRSQRRMRDFQADRSEKEKEVKDLKEEVERLKKALDHELEWHPYEMSGNVKQADYEHLRNTDDTRIMSDTEAKDLLYDWWRSGTSAALQRHRLELHPLRLRRDELRALQ